MKNSLLIIGGIFHIGVAIFHLLFWRLFHWEKDLASLTVINRAVMQILNLCLTFVFIAVAYISIFYSSELISTGVGKVVTASISLFWFFRLIEQLFFFGLKKKLSIVLTIFILIGFLLYFIPIF